MDTIFYLYRWNKPGKKNNVSGTDNTNSHITSDKNNAKFHNTKHTNNVNGINSQELKVLKAEELYCMEEYILQDYRLVKVGMHPELLRICNENCVGESGKENMKATGKVKESENVIGKGSKKRWGFLAGRRRKKEKRLEREMLAEFLQKLQDRQETPGNVQNMQENQDTSSFVCEETVALFAGREFNGYFQADYVRHMLRYGGHAEAFVAGQDMTGSGSAGRDSAGQDFVGRGMRVERKEDMLSHFVILGQCYCITEIIYEYVGNMKSLKWILPERQFREELEELVDILYEEYGLVAEVRLLSEEETFAKAHPVCRMPSVVLDFSEEDRIPTADVAKGSIWLDMGCSEAKRRRIEDRDTGISYFSLKKEWKQPQKAVNYLDTVSKNGYNT